MRRSARTEAVADPWLRARHRFFVEPDAIRAGRVRLSRDQAHQLRRVLRLNPGDFLIALDDSGREFLGQIESWEGGGASIGVVDERPNLAEARLHIALYQALLPRDKLDYVLQKGTEAGISRFVPIMTERTIARPRVDGERGQGDRWRRIVREAAEQCGRGRTPEVDQPVPLMAALERARADGPVLFAWERRGGEPIQSALRNLGLDAGRTVSIVVGPEGGFSEAEARQAAGTGARLVWLGPRILRSETAGPIVAALVLYESGDLGEAAR